MSSAYQKVIIILLSIGLMSVVGIVIFHSLV